MSKREVNQLLERLRSADNRLREHDYADFGDRRYVIDILQKDIAGAISTAEYLEAMAD